jgi:hypothetical protein
MPNFDLRLAVGASLAQWHDPDPAPNTAGSMPSRLRPHAGQPFLRWLGKVGILIELRAIVAGVEAPLDGVLGGNLFTGFLAEQPYGGPQGLTQPAGQTSRVRFTPLTAGHYLVGVRRTNGGAILLHLDVEPP